MGAARLGHDISEAVGSGPDVISVDGGHYIFPNLLETYRFEEEYKDRYGLKAEMLNKLTKGAL